jgi:hypothetical protein
MSNRGFIKRNLFFVHFIMDKKGEIVVLLAFRGEFVEPGRIHLLRVSVDVQKKPEGPSDASG